MVPIGAAIRYGEEQREFQRERTLRGLLHRPAQGDSSHGGLRLQDRARSGWQVRRLQLRDRRVERNSAPADGQGEWCLFSKRHSSALNLIHAPKVRPRIRRTSERRRTREERLHVSS